MDLDRVLLDLLVVLSKVLRGCESFGELLEHVPTGVIGPEQVVLNPTDSFLLGLIQVARLDTLLPRDVLILRQRVICFLRYNINGVVDTRHVPDELLALSTLVVDVEIHMPLEPEYNIHGHNEMMLIGVEFVTKALLFLRLHIETYMTNRD